MKALYIFSCFFIAQLFIFSCDSKDLTQSYLDRKDIIIIGSVSGLPDGKVYLANAYYWDKPMDSTLSTDGRFIFTIKNDSTFSPFYATINFPDSNSMFKIGSMFFENSKSTGFMVEPDTVYVSSMPYSKNEIMPTGGVMIRVNVTAGQQNEALNQNIAGDFGWLANTKGSERDTKIEYFKKQINKFPFSYFLLEGLYDSRNQYSEKEWNELLALFDKELQNSELANKVKLYLSNKPKPGEPLINLLVANKDGDRHRIINNAAKVNMLVFWASWCPPCRAEIPSLKVVHSNYSQLGLNMTSISLDEDREKWLKAMQEENMKWQQLLVDKDKMEMVYAHYDCQAIPVTIFTDATGRVIRRFVGYDTTLISEYKNILDSILLRK